ncbi:hypothetical protein ACFFTM_10595 [Pseudoduganella plicata]|uniref:Tetratricopeptide repeat protein n=1 Tax=Pseudoduganella plicata TaxID=321984 RepID=A0A4P7BD91_9BURK|nr:hypothetical protein [Pseudoduganella plicata]QBQ36103.1 hypothetical protein E1742_08005 [Pseudoduganella plicata]GGY78080.1 hypothetical protein GCM10007388_08640 [Pseudoduganella plicata]
MRNTLRPVLPALTLIASALLLCGCATDSTTSATAAGGATLSSAIAEAERSVAAGDVDRACSILRSAGTKFPAEKSPWIQIAQLKFDRSAYGEAINNALEGLQRDPNDRQGNSIVAVSGLRLSTKALADLSRQNHLGGPLRTEAQHLAGLLRTSLGEDVLVPAVQKPIRPVVRPRPAMVNSGSPGHKPAAAVTSQSNSADPFGALK